ncbi:MAG TPA: hypothetical protein VF534_17655 [Paraburkholderia sp.]
MVKKITCVGLIFAALAAGWVVLFERTPGQGYPREMAWVFHFLMIPFVAQCWILTDKSFWNAGWKDGLPVSPIFEKKWSENYFIIRGICAQARKAKDTSGLVDGGRYRSPFNLPVTGCSGMVLSKAIKIRQALAGIFVVLILFLIFTAPIANNSHHSLKIYIATSWPIIWISILSLQFILFGCGLVTTYWIVATFVSFLRGEK